MKGTGDVKEIQEHSINLPLERRDCCSIFEDYKAAVNPTPTLESAMQIGNGVASLTSNDSSFVAAFDVSTWSKEMILLCLEKVEFEIEQIEKELVKLDNEICVKLVSDKSYAERCETEDVKIERMSSFASEAFTLNFCQKHLVSQSVGEATKPTGDLNETLSIIMDTSVHFIAGSSHFPTLDCKEGERRIFNFSEMALPLIKANQKIAKMSLDSLAHLIPNKFSYSGINPYSSPEEASIWQCNIVNYERKKHYLQEKIVEGQRLVKFKELALAFQYQMQRNFWKQDLSEFFMYKTMGCDKSNNIYPLQQLPPQLQVVASGTAKLKAVPEERSSRALNTSQRTYLRMPIMLLDENERKSCKFVCNNGFVEDPVSLERERKLINPWSVEERKIFLEMFSAFGKDFSKIASFLKHKRVADCVEFYYRNRKSDDLDKVHRRQQWKRRRDSSNASALYLAATTSRNRFHHERGAAYVEGLTLVAAAAAAASEEMGKVNHAVVVDKSDLKDSGKVDICVSEDGTAVRRTSSVVANAGIKVYTDAASVNQRCISSSSVRKIKTSVISTGTKGSRSMHSNSVKASNRGVNSQWTDKERELFTEAVTLFGKDFHRISLHVGNRSESQCKTFFSKARKRLGLDQLVECCLVTSQGLCDSKQVDFRHEVTTDALTDNTVTEFNDACAAPLPVLGTRRTLSVSLGQADGANKNYSLAA